MLLLFSHLGKRKLSYQQRLIKLFGSSIIEYWRMTQDSGTNIVGKVNGLVAAATGLDWKNAPGPKSGPNVGYFDGVNDYVDLYSVGLASAFNGEEGSFLCWVRTDVAWVDGSAHFICNLQDNAGKVAAIRKTVNNNELWFQCSLAGGGGPLVTVSSLSTNWLPVGMSWSVVNNEFKAYACAGQIGTTATYGAGWGPLQPVANSLGSGLGIAAVNPWVGWTDHSIILNRPFTAAEWLAFTGA